jgi:hypothetical protein
MDAPQAAAQAAQNVPAAHRARRVRQVDSVPEDKTMLVKFCLDGFTWQRFLKLESHFQMGYAFVNVKGELQTDCCSRTAFKGIAKAVATEEEGIPYVLGVVNDELGLLEVLQLPDSSIVLKLASPTDHASFVRHYTPHDGRSDPTHKLRGRQAYKGSLQQGRNTSSTATRTFTEIHGGSTRTARGTRPRHRIRESPSIRCTN